MKLQILYKAQPGIEVETIAVLASFHNYDATLGSMKQSENEWIYETELSQGDYYYKFLINDTLLLNDPLANCYAPKDESEEELWSFLRIGVDGERLYNNIQNSVHIEDYQLSGVVTEGAVLERRQFSTILDKKVVARFGFNQTEGIHAVTVLWYGPDNELKEYAENVLGPQEFPEKMVYLWFWLDIKNLEQPEGLWRLKLFIDGTYVLEDQFQIGSAFLYSQDGRVKN